MKHLNDDELLMSAFDDVEEAELEGLDERQRSEYQALAGLKLDLKRLNDIPPCQLSSDRLRRRILEEGIQGSRKGFTGWFAFASAGAVSCACMAAAAIMIWNWYQPAQDASEPLLAVKSSTQEAEPALNGDVQPSVDSALPEPKSVEAKVKPMAKEEARPRLPRRPNRISAPEPAMTLAANMNSTGYVTRTAEEPKAEAEPVSMTAADAAALLPPGSVETAPPSSSVPAASHQGRSAAVVVIGQSPTSSSPAVESAGHVVFGG